MDQPKRFACTVIQIKSSAYIVSDYEPAGWSVYYAPQLTMHK